FHTFLVVDIHSHGLDTSSAYAVVADSFEPQQSALEYTYHSSNDIHEKLMEMILSLPVSSLFSFSQVSFLLVLLFSFFVIIFVLFFLLWLFFFFFFCFMLFFRIFYIFFFCFLFRFFFMNRYSYFHARHNHIWMGKMGIHLF